MDTGTATRLWALDGAKFTIDCGMLMVGGTGTIEIPVATYLIQHPRGLVLYDTGMAPESVEDPEGVYGPLAAFLQMEFTDDLRVDRQLEAVGFTPDDVTHVVVSHTHFDHVGALRLFPNAEFFVGAEELPYAYWPVPAQHAFYRTADLDAIRGFKLHLLEGDHDLFGDGSVQILRFPGHTPGHCGLLLRLPNRNLMMTGDTVHLREAISGELPAPSDHNTLAAVTSIRRMKQLALAHDAQIMIHHDPDDWKALRELNDALD